MKPFRKPAWQKTVQSRIMKKQDEIVAIHQAQMMRILNQAAARVAQTATATGKFAQPDLRQLYPTSERFYRAVITAAYLANKENELVASGKRRLAKLPLGLPRTFRDLQQIFKDREFWPKVQKRSKILTNKLVAEYVKKLRKRFATIAPLLQTGEITPQQVKAKLMEAPDATKALVETRFRTETTTYFAQAQVKFYEGEDQIIGFLFDSIRDVSRTDICRSRHGLIYKPGTKELAENTPALHYNCRSHLIALANTPRNRKMLEDPERDPALKKVAELPPGWIAGR